MGRDYKFRVRCAKCHHWLFNAGGDAFSVEIKCSHCAAVTHVEVKAGSMSVETDWGKRQAAERVA